MKKNIKIVIITFILLAIPVKVYAHPGSLAADNCHYCRTNCEKWGLVANERHCHSGDTYTNSKGQIFNSSGTMIQDVVVPEYVEPTPPENSYTPPSTSTNNNNYTYVPEVKSNDNSIKELKINSQIIDITDNMQFTTTEENVLIEVLLNDEKASYNLENNNLELGDNLREIIVTAENGDTKIYSIKIIREKIKYNTEFELTINAKKIEFINNKAEITIDSEITDLDYKIDLEDDRVKLKVEGDTNLKEGTNLVKYIIIDPYGEEYLYELTVEKEKNQPVNSILETLVVLGIITYIIICFAGYKLYMKNKKGNLKEEIEKDLNKLKSKIFNK